MKPILIDLRNLTQAHIDEALPHMEGCRYQDPCIIGSLVPPELRASIDGTAAGFSDNVHNLVNQSLIKFPNEKQAMLANRLQERFDNGDVAGFRDVLNEIAREFDLKLEVPDAA